MFLLQKQEYPKADEIHKKTARKTVYEFLSYAPREEFEKLNLAQIDYLFDKGLLMPRLSSSTRSSDMALY